MPRKTAQQPPLASPAHPAARRVILPLPLLRIATMSLRFTCITALLGLALAAACPAIAGSFAGTSAGTSAGASSNGTSGTSGSTSGDDKLILEARRDAAAFVATQGRIRGLRLEAALRHLRAQPGVDARASDLALAKAILAK